MIRFENLKNCSSVIVNLLISGIMALNKTFLFRLLSDFRKSLQKWFLAKWTALPRDLASQNSPCGLIPTGLLLQESTSFTPWQGPRGKGPVSQFHIYTFNQRMLWSQIASLPLALNAGSLVNQAVIRLVNRALDPFQYFKKPEIRVKDLLNVKLLCFVLFWFWLFSMAAQDSSWG